MAHNDGQKRLGSRIGLQTRSLVCERLDAPPWTNAWGCHVSPGQVQTNRTLGRTVRVKGGCVGCRLQVSASELW